MQKSYQFKPIGIIHSCFKEKFGIPRQARLATEATATLELIPPYNNENSIRELENFSHIWLIFIFHQSLSTQWKAMVRPPRLGGNKRVGVFASRSPFRPNPIGMSLIKLRGITQQKGKLSLELQGADLLDQTPVIDIKPYIPYADSVENAQSAYAPTAPETLLPVVFSETAQQQCREKEKQLNTSLSLLITQILQQDPRPSYKTDDDERIYAMKLYDFDLRWRYQNQHVYVIELHF